METYSKPSIVDNMATHGLIPAAAFVTGLSAAKLLAVGVAAGLAAGAAASSREIHFDHISSLPLQRREFAY